MRRVACGAFDKSYGQEFRPLIHWLGVIISLFFKYREKRMSAVHQMSIFQSKTFVSPDLFSEIQPLQSSAILLEFRFREIEYSYSS